MNVKPRKTAAKAEGTEEPKKAAPKKAAAKTKAADAVAGSTAMAAEGGGGVDPKTGKTQEEREAENMATQRQHQQVVNADEVVNEPAGVKTASSSDLPTVVDLDAEPPVGLAHSSNALEQPPVDPTQAKVYPNDVLPGVEKKTNVLVVNRSKLQKAKEERADKRTGKDEDDE